MDNSMIWNGQKFFSIAKDTQEKLKKLFFQKNFQITLKLFVDIVRVIKTSKLSILKTFQGGGLLEPPPHVK